MESRSVHETEEPLKTVESATNLEHKDLEGAAIFHCRKSGSPKGSGHSIFSSVSKIMSHIKKPSIRRSGSPLNWFPRKKGDTYLKRKIKLLQQNEGMNLSLDETLGNANPHYTKIAREKIAAREAAQKAMTARKNAMVEASWCKILKAARIQSKVAEAELEKAQKCAAEAFEAAREKGVTMYDKPDTSRKLCEVESYSSAGGKSTHTVTASFETAFEVDKEVMAAIKKAFIQYANCPDSSDKEEFKDLLWKVSQNPEYTESDLESSDISSELVNAMLERLKNLQENELSSLATVVATCGLNAALLKLEHSNKDHEKRATTARRISSATCFIDGCLSKKETNVEFPSLDKFLVKHMSKLEKEVQEARSSTNHRSSDFELKPKNNINDNNTSVEPAADLGSILVRHVSKLEKEVQEAKKLQKYNSKNEGKGCKENVDCNMQQTPLKHITRLQRAKLDELNSPSLDKILIKSVHKLEKDVREARSSTNHRNSDFELKPKNNINDNNTSVEPAADLGSILVKHVSKLEKEVQEAKKLQKYNSKNEGQGCKENVDCNMQQTPLKHMTRLQKAKLDELNSPSLDKILIKSVHKLEKEKMEASRKEYGVYEIKKIIPRSENVESLDKALVKHQSKPEKENMAETEKANDNKLEDYTTHASARKDARERELQEAWGGLSLGNSIRPHISRLERDRAAWKKAEEEEQKAKQETK